METLFLTLLELSLSASVLTLALIILRLLLRRSPRWVFCLLWGLVALRLVCPVSVESDLSLQPRIRDTVVQGVTSMPSTQGSSSISPTQDPVTAPITNQVTSTAKSNITGALIHNTGDPVIARLSLTTVFAWAWAAGTTIMALLALTGYLRLRHRMATATRLRGNIYQSERVDSPFILGLFQPRIYLPYDLDGETMSHVIAHEKSHIHRGDHWWKLLGYLLLSVYWFCPPLWVAYWLMCKDIELACDERVIKDLEPDARQDYALALLNLGVRRSPMAACPLAFGEVGVKRRVKNVMYHKKPAFWVVVLALLAAAVVAVCFLTDPKSPAAEKPEGSTDAPAAGSWFLQSEDPAYATEIDYSDRSQLLSQNQLVFRDPDAAFDAMLRDYEEAIAHIEKRSDLDPLSRDNFRVYQNSIRNLPDDETALRIWCEDLFRFFNIYGNSVSDHGTVYPRGTSYPTIYGTFTIGKFLAQQAGLSYRPEDGSYYQQITLSLVLDGDTALEVVNHQGSSIYSNYDNSLAVISNVYSRQELILLLEEKLLFTSEGELTREKLELLVPETVETIYAQHYPDAEDSTETAYTVYWFDGVPTWFVEGEDLRFYEIVTSTGAETNALSTPQDPLDKAVSQAILDSFLPEKPDGLVYCESHVTLTQETIIACGPVDSTACGQWTTVYVLVMEANFSLSGGSLEPAGGAHYPAAITFRKEDDGSYTLTEFWTPRDGAHLESDVRERFPDQVEEDALDTQKFVVQQTQDCYAQVIEYADIQTGSIIEELLTTITSSTAHGQLPTGYIEAHGITYRELLYYGEYTLRYCFREFLEGGQDGLEGEVMSSVCQEIMALWGETLLIDSLAELNGQQWFDEFQANSHRLQEQYQPQELQELYPGTWLLLQIEYG